MVSLKELQYVGSWESKAPFPGEKYAWETLEQMSKLLEVFKKCYKNKDYSIIFSDGKEINFEILPMNICHMFGIGYKNLSSGYFANFFDSIGVEKFTSYELVEYLLDNAAKVIANDSDPYKSRLLNYYKCRIKCAIFDKLGKFEEFNFGKIETIDRKSDVNGEAIASEPKKSILFYTASNEPVCPYFFIRIVPHDGDTSKYVVNSLLAPPSIELANYFDGSEAAIPTQMIGDDRLNKLNKCEATPRQKIGLLLEYRQLISTLGIKDCMNISADYFSILHELDSIYKKDDLGSEKKLILR